MRLRLINFLKMHPFWVTLAWSCARLALTVWGWFVPIREKTMMFASFGGRKYDDSPKAIYDEICLRPEFADWTLIWAFVEPEKFDLPRGEKVRVDTPAFFHALLYSRVWVSNSGMDRGIELKRKGVIKVETWHGSAFKRGTGDEKQNTLGGEKTKTHTGPRDSETIRCVQSPLDLEVYMRGFHATEDSFLKCGFPRNDALFRYTEEDVARIRENLHIPAGKKVLLYAPTYREYLLNEDRECYLAPPIHLDKWEKALGGQYVLLMRMHYAVSASLGIQDTDFVKDVSAYPSLNDLYAIADCMISDYSSTFIDYSFLGRPMFSFAYDLDEFEEKRGFYFDYEATVPCPRVDRDEDSLLESILTMDEDVLRQKAVAFQKEHAPYGGHATEAVVDAISKRIHA